MLITIEIHITCDLPGGSRPPITPFGSAHAKSLNVSLPHRSFHLVFIEDVSSFKPNPYKLCLLKVNFRPDIFAKSPSSFNITFHDVF